MMHTSIEVRCARPPKNAPHVAKALLSLFATSLATAGWGASRVGRSETIEQASRSFDDAQYRKDVGEIARRLAPGMIYISGSGRIGGQREFIAAFADPNVRFEPFVITDRRVVLLHPGAAVATAEGRISGTDVNGPFHDHFRFSDTFTRHAGRWRVAYVQVTRLP